MTADETGGIALITPAVDLPPDNSISILVGVFMTISLYNALELIVLIFVNFRRYQGWYFWSLLIATIGVAIHALGYMLRYFHFDKTVFTAVTVSVIGWIAMVTGQSLVLWSRLNLVVQHRKILRGILYMIIANAICLNIPTIVLTYGINADTSSATDGKWTYGYSIMERLQLTGFSLQEFIISTIYISKSSQILKNLRQSRPHTHKFTYQLIATNILFIFLDVILLTLQYLSYSTLQTTVKSLVYSVKLKLEFAVLGKMVALISHRGEVFFAPIDHQQENNDNNNSSNNIK
ncbi:hypothetical protein FQN54_007645 [Arachnomyces sp. PD_36]|nr:hypothetical protein FQN54_007645 [Arachnomyces sp. PD_36]